MLYNYSAEVIKVVDADTLDVNLDLGFNTHLKGIRIRLDRIDAYEIRLTKGVTEEEKQKGLEAKAFVVEQISKTKSIVVNTKEKDSFGRWIAEVTVDNVNLSDFLVDKGFAVYKTY